MFTRTEFNELKHNKGMSPKAFEIELFFSQELNIICLSLYP